MSKFNIAIYKALTTGGLQGSYEVPGTLVEFVTAATVPATATTPAISGEDKILRIATQNVIYHSVLGAIRGELSDAILDKSKADGREFPMLTEKRKTGAEGKEVDVIVESDEDYAKRAVASEVVSVEWLKNELQSLLDNDENAFAKFLQSPERKPKAPAKLPKELEAAIVAAIADGKSVAMAQVLSTKLGRTVDPTNVLDLGNAVKEVRAAAAKAAAADLGL